MIGHKRIIFDLIKMWGEANCNHFSSVPSNRDSVIDPLSKMSNLLWNNEVGVDLDKKSRSMNILMSELLRAVESDSPSSCLEEVSVEIHGAILREIGKNIRLMRSEGTIGIRNFSVAYSMLTKRYTITLYDGSALFADSSLQIINKELKSTIDDDTILILKGIGFKPNKETV